MCRIVQRLQELLSVGRGGLLGALTSIVRHKCEMVLVFTPEFLYRQLGNDSEVGGGGPGGLWPSPPGLWANCVGLLPVRGDLYSTLGTNAVRRYGLIMERRPAEHSEEIKACLWNEPFKVLIDFCLSLSLTLTVMKTRPAAAGNSRPTNRLSC